MSLNGSAHDGCTNCKLFSIYEKYDNDRYFSLLQNYHTLGWVGLGFSLGHCRCYLLLLFVVNCKAMKNIPDFVRASLNQSRPPHSFCSSIITSGCLLVDVGLEYNMCEQYDCHPNFV